MVSRLAGHQISFHMNVVQWHAERDDDDDCGKELTECRVQIKRFLDINLTIMSLQCECETVDSMG